MKDLFLIPVFTLFALAGCGDGGTYVEPTGPVTPPTTGDDATIGGITWATHNVGAPGTFTSNPQDLGMVYKWGDIVGWSATDPLTSSPAGESWDTDYDGDGSWTAEDDPCPEDWRVPTWQEMQSLVNANFKWGTLNGVRGASFTDKTNGNSIFIPASFGREDNGDYAYNHDTGAFVRYWTTTAYPQYNGNCYVLCFSSLGVETPQWDYTQRAYSVRCVAE